MDRRQVMGLLGQRTAEIRGRFGVGKLAIFGSVARDEARANSDLDVLVEFVDRPNFDNYMGLKLYLEELFGVRVDLVTAAALRQELRSHVQEELLHVP